MNSLVGQSTGTADNTDDTLLVDMTGHNTDLALAGGNDARAVGADKAGLALSDQGVLHLHHVLLRDALGDAHNQGDLGLECLEDGGRSTGRRDVDDGGVRLDRIVRLGHRVEHGQAKVFAAA